MFEKLTTKLKQLRPDSSQKHPEDADNNASETENLADKNKKMNKRSMAIRVLVVLVIAYFVVDQFILNDKNNNQVVDIPVKPRKRRKPVPPKVDPAKAEEAKPAEKVAEKAPGAIEAKPEEKSEAKSEVKSDKKEEMKADVKIETTAPVENINIAEKKAEEPANPIIDEVPVDEIVKAPPEKTPKEISPKVGEMKSSEKVDQSLDSLIDSVDSKESLAADNQAKKPTSLEDKIVADDVYVAPPVYDQLGRGLVYNCKEKYWSCVDKLSYVTCNKNMKWNKAHQKPIECAVSNVYNSDDDCGVVQKYNISTSKPTAFCQ